MPRTGKSAASLRRAVTLGAVIGVIVAVTGQSTATAVNARGSEPKAASGFAVETVANGLRAGSSMAFLPDGGVVVGQQPGTVALVRNGAVTPLLDISDHVNSTIDRGLLGIVVDPAFASNGYVFVLYTYEDHQGSRRGPTNMRVSRFTVRGDTADPNTETPILGSVVGTDCSKAAVNADCIENQNPYHAGGGLVFAPDGTLFVGIGDGSDPVEGGDSVALDAQRLDVPNGKVLHITTTGEGLPANPFWDGNPDSWRSKIYVLGNRNPFRVALEPGSSDTLVIGDVGWIHTEEIDTATAGVNLGWPCYEGNQVSEDYGDRGSCPKLLDKGAGATQGPVWSYERGKAPVVAVIGGVFYTGTAYPPELQNMYVYGDFGLDFVRTINVEGQTRVRREAKLVDNAGKPTQIAQGPDGHLYYLALGAGELRRIVYNPGG